MRTLLVAKMGTTLPEIVARRGDYEDWIVAGLARARAETRVVRVYEGEALPDPKALAGVVVTGSSAMVSRREPWSERAAEWLAAAVAAGTPVLGICYGHQLLAHALGGRVGVNPRGPEMGTVSVRLREEARDDALFASLGAELRVQATHVESVLELPPGAHRLAANAADPHQAFAASPAAWGVQFHPEFDADVMRGYLEARREIVASEGADVDALLQATSDAPHGRTLLRRFSELLR